MHGVFVFRRGFALEAFLFGGSMSFDFSFFFTALMLGVGLAMDAFSVSLANGLNEPKMKPIKMSAMAGVFALFQFAMPVTGWLCVKTVASALI